MNGFGFNSNNIRVCEVKLVEDDSMGQRVKVRLFPDDNHIIYDSDLPFAFPLLPKMLHVTPKKGECVLVILAENNNKESQRFYIGPVISQPQRMYNDPYNFTATSLLNGNSVMPPLENPDMNSDITGSLPAYDDVAIEGRMNADLQLKENELRLRCGFNSQPSSPIPRNIHYNKKDTSYIQMKFFENKLQTENGEVGSVINVVADKINLLSHKSNTTFKLSQNGETPISDEQLRSILKDAHPIVYGDILVDFLQKLIKAFSTHTHPFPMDPPTVSESVKTATTYSLPKMLSASVRAN